ncbi:MAG: response regulator transcription factor [Pseudomonadales bacterium]
MRESMTHPNKHFLLVDDDITFTEVLSRALRRRGFQVTTAHDSEQALEAAKSNNFSHAILDLKLEGPSGLSLINPLLELQPQLQILMLTGYSSIATAVEAIKLGARNYLCKPAKTDEILAALEQQAIDGSIEVPIRPPSVDRIEWEHIQRVLQENDGNISATARALGMHRRTLQRKLQKKPVRQ